MRKLFFGIFTCLFFYAPLHAAPFESCPELVPFEYTHPQVTERIRGSVEICFDDFALLYSPVSKTAVLSIEKLNSELLKKAYEIERAGEFYEEARLPERYRAKLKDYKAVYGPNQTKYDRGHLASAANRYKTTGMYQSMSLANQVMQTATANRKHMAKIEKDVRKFAARTRSDTWIFTGPLFLSTLPTQKAMESGMWIPDATFKLVWDKANRKAFAYIVNNSEDTRFPKPMGYPKFVELTGLNILPGMLRP